MIARITMIGEKSMPPRLMGSLRLIGYSTGSVTELRNLTTALKGSGFTQEMTARAMMIHMYSVNAISITLAMAIMKLAATGIEPIIPPEFYLRFPTRLP